MRAAVGNAGRVPVTVKMRIGIDDEHRTHLEAGRSPPTRAWRPSPCTRGRRRSATPGTADWSAIARLRDALPAEVPVLGNGDIFSAADALAMVAETGCDGVVVGRGCLGRPWLFGDLEAAFAGRPLPAPPTLGQVAATLRRHAELLGPTWAPDKGIRDVRKHIAWYLKGFPVGPELRRRLGLVGSLDELDELLARLDPASRSRPTPRARAAGRARPAGSCCPSAGSTTPTTRRSRSARSSSTRAGEVPPGRPARPWWVAAAASGVCRRQRLHRSAGRWTAR